MVTNNRPIKINIQIEQFYLQGKKSFSLKIMITLCKQSLKKIAINSKYNSQIMMAYFLVLAYLKTLKVTVI